MADAFIGGPLDPRTTWPCQRLNGDTLRYNEETDEFAIMDRNGFIVTYFRPDPQEHGQPSNLAYFRRECRK
jgi:filamentous hemagglutinin